jgi:hypothetical protein
MKIEFSRHIFEKSLNINFRQNPSSGSRVVSCGQTDERTLMTKPTDAFRNFANAPENLSQLEKVVVEQFFLRVPQI